MPNSVPDIATIFLSFFFFNDTAPPEIYPSSPTRRSSDLASGLARTRAEQGLYAVPCPLELEWRPRRVAKPGRSEEHTSELQSRLHLVCRLLLEKKKKHEAGTLHHIGHA